MCLNKNQSGRGAGRNRSEEKVPRAIRSRTEALHDGQDTLPYTPGVNGLPWKISPFQLFMWQYGKKNYEGGEILV